jgi:hypothetical protein
MSREQAKLDVLTAARDPAIHGLSAAFDSLPFIDNETLDDFLADQESVELLPVDPREYRRELQRLIVSAFLHTASIRAKQVVEAA